MIGKINKISEFIGNIKGLSRPKLEKEGVDLEDIDPFTILALFNKGITDENRKTVAGEIKKEFELKSEVPEDFSGVPVVDNRNAAFYQFKGNRGERDLDNLWEVFCCALDYAKENSEENRKRFVESFNIVTKQWGIKWTITMALYWIRPNKFINLDVINRDYLKDKLLPETSKSYNDFEKMLNGEQYCELCDHISELCKNDEFDFNSFSDLSQLAWLASKEDQKGRSNNNGEASTGTHEENKAMNPQNIILYGPPGTGKTYSIKARVVNICDPVDTGDMEEAVIKERFDKLVSGGRVVFTTFHQSYGYEEFVEGIAPVIKDPEESQSNLQYTLKPGVFKLICDKARNDKNNHYVIVIDEINRGNISKIFGELITLIEESKREGNTDEVSVLLPYSQASFTVPNNLSIIGTMNTADRSIAMIDTALRRRFKFIEMMPQPEMLTNIKIQNSDASKTIDLVKMLDIMNKRIERLYDREHTIGHAFFLSLKDNSNLEKLAEIFKYKIIPLLQEYFYEDYSKISLVLGDNQKADDSIRFIVKEEKPSIDELFGKNSGQDLPEAYSINSAAFDNIDSYIGIYENK